MNSGDFSLTAGSLLEQADHPAGFQVEVHVVEDGAGGQAGHGAHLAAERVEEAGADAGPDVADREDVAVSGGP